jgi:hypothetical protein
VAANIILDAASNTMQFSVMNTTNEATTITFDVPEYHDLDFRREYDQYLAQVYRDQYAFGPFTGEAF